MFESLLGDIALLIGSLAATFGILFWIERTWPATLRMQHNDIIGWQINILGTIYAIILGFMLYTTWNSFQAAKQNAGAEGTALVNLARLGHALPAAQDAMLTPEARDYASVIVTKEWRAMQDGQFAPESRVAIQRLWATLASVQPQTPGQQAALVQAWSELSTLTDHRRMRRIEMTDSLPGILWVVLDSGGALLLLCCCLFGSYQIKLHGFLVMILSFLLTLLLLTIAGVDRPFQGWLHVPVEAFQAATAPLNEP